MQCTVICRSDRKIQNLLSNTVIVLRKMTLNRFGFPILVLYIVTAAAVRYITTFMGEMAALDGITLFSSIKYLYIGVRACELENVVCMCKVCRNTAVEDNGNKKKIYINSNNIFYVLFAREHSCS